MSDVLNNLMNSIAYCAGLNGLGKEDILRGTPPTSGIEDRLKYRKFNDCVWQALQSITPDDVPEFVEGLAYYYSTLPSLENLRLSMLDDIVDLQKTYVIRDKMRLER